LISISADRIQEILTMPDCIQAMENLYRNEGNNINEQPLRIVMRTDPETTFLTMPGYSKVLQRFATKIVTEFKNNPVKYHLPAQGGLIVLIDGKDSRVLATLDAPMITAVRTGAVSGLATKLLAREDSEAVGIIGSGQQARTQLSAVCAVRRKIRRARVYSRNHEHAVDFSKAMGEELGIAIEPEPDPASALKRSDIAILATSTTTPVVSWKEVPSGCHINSIGGTMPSRQELDLDTICNSRIFVDLRQGVLSEAGDVMHAIGSGKITANHIIGDLSDLILKRSVGRENDEQVTLFKSVGFALQDLYASSFAFEKISVA